MVFFKGKCNIKFNPVINDMMFCESDAEDFIRGVDEKLNGKLKKINILFNSRVENYKENDIITDSSKKTFDEIMSEIVGGEKAQTETAQNESKYSNNINYMSSFDIIYYIRIEDESYNKNRIKEIVEKAIIKYTRCKFFQNRNIVFSNHILKKITYLEMFDLISHRGKSAIKRFCEGIIDDQEACILGDSLFCCEIKIDKIPKNKLTYEELCSKYVKECRYNSLKNEIKRAYSVGNNNKIQGVNYLFNEKNSLVRKKIYQVLTEMLYSVGRLKEPFYNIVEINLNDRDFSSIAVYLKNRLKMSPNSLYFFEFYSKKEHQDGMFIGNYFEDIKDDLNNLIDSFIQNQYFVSFGFYVDENVKQEVPILEDKKLIEKFSFVVFDGKLNKEAQIEYIKTKLNTINQLDVFNTVNEIINYQNYQIDGLTTYEIDDYILMALKNKYDIVYKPIYKNATSELFNGNIIEKLMSMVGLQNLKNAVAEMKNRINFKEINEELLPVTRALKQLNCMERNNWILTGEPGIGKSSAAELLQKIMYQERIINKDILVKYTPTNKGEVEFFNPFGEMFGSQYSNNIFDSFQEATGGVLVIDEIGHLSKQDKSLLLQLMEDNKNKVVVILCGYENEAKELLNYNPGFRSRFTHIIKLENYTTDELYQILENKLKEKHFKVEDSQYEILKDIINDVKAVPNFGHARFMESLADKLIAIHASNKLELIEKSLKEHTTISIDDEGIYTIDELDINNLKLDEMLGEEYNYIKKHGNPIDELNNLIGCNEAKQAIKEFMAKTEMDIIKIKKKLIDKNDFNMHMVFYGSPGTAKTTVARLVGKILYGKGIINHPKVFEVGASDLVGEYVGETAIKTTKVFEKAKGGILFIDEAYALANKEAGGFNQEAIDTIIKQLEECRNNTMVIFAGYKEPMERFIKSNPGFKSRISKFVSFSNYSKEELINIFEKTVHEMGYTLEAINKEKIINIVGTKLENMMQDDDFGNGRACRTIIEGAINKQSERIIKNSNNNNFDDEELMTLAITDFESYTIDFYEKPPKIGFLSNA